MAIERICADSDNRDSNTYRLLNIVHSMAGQMAVAKIGGWVLAETYTHDGYALTVWTNGIVDVQAISRGDKHQYAMYAAEN